MKRWYLFALISLYFAALSIRLIPPLTNAVWGADTGENYYLSNYFAVHLTLPNHYYGFGLTYTEFPVVYVLTGLSAVLMSLNTYAASELLMPFLTSLLVFPVAGITTYITKREGTGIGAATFYAASSVIVAHTSILASDTLGEFLLIFFIYFYLKTSRSRLYTAAAAITAFAAVPSYHVGTIMLILFLYSALIYSSWMSKDRTEMRRALYFILGVSTWAWAYWLNFAPVFVHIFILGNPHLDIFEAVAAPYALAAAIIILGRFISIRKIPQGDLHRTLTLPFIALAAVPLAALSFTGWKAQSILPSLFLLSFIPTAYIALIAVVQIIPMSREHGEAWPVTIALLLTGVVILVGLITQLSYLVPFRVVEYALLFLSPFAGYAIIRIHNGSRTASVLLVASFFLLSGVSMATLNHVVMPSKTGSSPVQDIYASEWIYWNTQRQAVVASDHPLSSIAFAFGGRNATWEKGGYPIFESRDLGQLYSSLNSTYTPSGMKPVDLLLLDSYMISEGNYYPNQSALPVSGSFLTGLQSGNFVLLYSNGVTEVYAYVP